MRACFASGRISAAAPILDGRRRRVGATALVLVHHALDAVAELQGVHRGVPESRACIGEEQSCRVFAEVQAAVRPPRSGPNLSAGHMSLPRPPS
jgi:hypothetical protein